MNMKAIDSGDTVCTMIFGFPSGVKAIEAFVSQKPDKIWKNPGPGFNSFYTPIDLAVNSKGILLLTQKFNYFKLHHSDKQILDDAIGVKNGSNYGRFAL